MNAPLLIDQATRPGGGGAPKLQVTLEFERINGDEEFYNADTSLAKRIGELLLETYPGHFWRVKVSHQQGIALFTLPLLYGDWWWCIKTPDYTDAQVVKGGGELLERLKMGRGRFNLTTFLEARTRAISRHSDKLPE